MKRLLYILLMSSYALFSCTDIPKTQELEEVVPSKEKTGLSISTVTQAKKEQVSTPIIETSEEKATEKYTTIQKRSLCTQQPPKIKENQAQKVNLSPLSAKIQSFKIDPKKEQVITTKEGVSFIIPPYTFDTDAETVTLNVKEFFGKKAAYTAGLTTLTTTGTILESGGMFDLAAKANGIAVELREGGEIILQLPKAAPADMNVYYGEENESGDVVWELDELGTTVQPVIVLGKGVFGEALNNFFTTAYKLEKEKMLDLVDKQWTTAASFNQEGKMIGYTKCAKSSEENNLITVACQQFFEVMTLADPSLFKSVVQQWDNQFNFVCMDYKTYLSKRAKEVAASAMDIAVSNFESRNSGKPRKYFSIGELGLINIDMDIPLPEGQALAKVAVEVQNDGETIKLLFKEKNVVISPTVEAGQYVFKRIPTHTTVQIIATYAKADKVYYASKEYTVVKKQPKLALEYQSCEIGELNSKLAAICQ